jgi:rod shape-determining protein MreD
VLAARSILAGQSQVMMWLWYALSTALALGAGYLFTMLLTHTAPDPVTVGWQFLATVVLYPFANLLIERFEDADVRFR